MVITVHLPSAPAPKHSLPAVDTTTRVNTLNHTWTSLQAQETGATQAPAQNPVRNVSLTCSTGILPFQAFFLTPKACLLSRGLGGIASEHESAGNLGLLASKEQDAAAVAILKKWRKHFSSTMRIHNWFWQYIPLILLLALYVFQHSPPTSKHRPPHIPSQPQKLLFSAHSSHSLADLGQRPVTGRRRPGWMPAAGGCFQISLHFSAPLETRLLAFLCVNVTSKKIPIHLSVLLPAGRARHGPVLCCGAAAANQCFEPGRCSHLVPAGQELPASLGYSPGDWSHKFTWHKLSLHHITRQGSERQVLFIIFLKWKPEEVTLD